MKQISQFSSIITILLITSLVLLIGCTDDIEDGFQETYTSTAVIPETISSNLNFPWGVEFIDTNDSHGVGNGSVLKHGQLLVANRGTVGQHANTIVNIDPASGSKGVYSHSGITDSLGISAVDIPHDIAFSGPFVWIANDADGLGTVSATDPNPATAPNGYSGQSGEPVPGPGGTGVFQMEDFGFMVTSVTPEHQATGVFHHTTIAVEFSSPVDPNTVMADTFKVQVDYSPLSPDPADPVGSFEFSNDYKRVEFVYVEDLAEATRYKIILDEDILSEDGVKLDGDLSSPGPDDFESLFTVGSGNPMVIWVKPENGESFVSKDTVVQVGFSEAMQASSVTTSGFFLEDADGDKVASDVHIDASLTVATLVPRDSLLDNTTYTVEVNYRVKDITGLSIDMIPGGVPDAFHSQFSTGAGGSNPPQVTGATITGDLLTITFNKEIDPGSRSGSYLSVTNNQSQNVPGTINWPSDTQLNFTATNGFSEGYYEVCVEDVLTDTQGVQLDGDGDGYPGGQYCINIPAGGDRLYVTSSYPVDGDTNVGTSSQVFLNFSKPVNPSSVTSNSIYLVDADAPQDPVPAAITVNPGDTSIGLAPDSMLNDNTVYIMTVTTDVTDYAGNSLDQDPGLPLDSFTATFQTGGEDRTPPCVLDSTPADGDGNIPVGISISVRFTEPVVTSSVNSGSFFLTGPSGRVPGSFQFQENNALVVLQPESELIAEENYTVTLTTSIIDPSGNSLDGDCDGSSGPDYTMTFTTGTGGVVINEVVVDPQQDWNDSEGGDGSPFNGVPGSGSVTTSDEWIEIYNASGQTINLNNWTLEMNDSTPETHIIGGGSGTESVFPPTATISNFPPGAYLVIGNPVGSNNMDCYFVLRDSGGTLIDDVEIGDDPENDGEGDGAPEAGEDGNADSIGNEAVARVPNGLDSDNDAVDFAKQAASIGADNGGERGFGTRAGYWGTGVGLVGMSGITSAGEAPDNPDYMSRLVFASHTRRGIVYGIDLDDGAYFAFGGSTAPMGVEYVPITSDPQPGKGYLFVTDPVDGNIARVRMKPSGPVGNHNTQSVEDTSSPNSVLYMAYPLLNNPVGIAYSEQHDRIYIACRDNGLVLEITVDGDLTEIFDTGLGADSLGGIDVGDMGSGDVVFITYTGGERVGTSDGPQGSLLYFNPHP